MIARLSSIIEALRLLTGSSAENPQSHPTGERRIGATWMLAPSKELRATLLQAGAARVRGLSSNGRDSLDTSQNAEDKNPEYSLLSQFGFAGPCVVQESWETGL